MSILKILTAKVFEPLLQPARYKGAFGGRGSGKCVIWDKVMGLGVTPQLAGDVSTWAGMIMGFYFGKRTFENVVRILKR
ncbi:hypothetical protein IC762_25425 [Bradyrhizobium genosp. L]|uniref:hypothetical protein n=1 Tax=Bradyrhizobium genosp. L TaxID=83637 RepID=UPI0018A2DA78|nr:hypothetical protein [Bradyrhizobium genosp. L]QPF83059.1 hypothetical protein IC762_25425 [Bradyrhizobium genosp. L]